MRCQTQLARDESDFFNLLILISALFEQPLVNDCNDCANTPRNLWLPNCKLIRAGGWDAKTT